MAEVLEDHNWPTDPGEHLWSRWWNEKGPPKPTQYRVCVHSNCKAVERREVPSA